MANTVYDSDSDQQHDIDHIRAAEAKPTDTENASPQSLSDQENESKDKFGSTSGEKNTDAPRSSKDNDDTVGEKGYTGGGKKKGLRAKLQGLGRGRKAILVAGAGGGFGVIGIILLLFLLASSLKIPNLAQNLETYEFARLTRQFSKSADLIANESLGVQSADDGLYSKLVAKYPNTIGRVDSLRLQSVMDTLQRENGLKFTTHNTLTGRVVLDSVELDGQTYKVAQTGGVSKFVPLLSDVKEFRSQAAFSKAFTPALESSLAANDIGPFMRSAYSKKILAKLGIDFSGWALGKFKGDTPEEAVLENERQSYNDTLVPGVDETPVGELNQAAEDAQNTTTSDVKSDTDLKQIIAAGGDDQKADAKVAEDVGQSNFKKALGYVDPAYQWAMYACIIYSGSIDSSQSTTDAQTTEQERVGAHLMSTGNQLQAGTSSTDPAQATELALAAGAMSQKVGNTDVSNIEMEASGQSVDTTTTSLSSQASSTGDYTLFNLIPGFGGSAVGDFAATVAEKGCGALTNVWGAVGIGIVNIGVNVFGAIFGGGTPTELEGAAEAGTDAVVETSAESFVQRFVTNVSDSFTKENASNVAVKLRSTLGLDNLKKEGAKLGVLAGITVLAKLEVMSHAHTQYDGLEQNADYVNEGQAGLDSMQSQLEQQEMAGRPMTQSEVNQSDQADQYAIANTNNSKSLYDRYLATSNADSLLDRTAMSVSANLNGSFFHSLLKMASMLFRPTTYVGSLATSLNKTAHAASSNLHYGNVQFGWSQDEENLIDSNESYSSSLENQAALDGSGEEDAIASHYGKCFTDSIGTMLATGEIMRDKDGNVIADQGLCSPNNLGPTNSDPSSPCGSSGCGDLVFRYRLAMQYNTTLTQLSDEQQVTP